ncbi:MAG: ABC transporter permease subunit [Spirochaetaceae bacterium]|nr:ABC transporter permease subunit [Spirochaetaceae bacterium]
MPLRSVRRIGPPIGSLVLRVGSGLTFFLLVLMVVVLTDGSVRFFRTESVSLFSFIFGLSWQPELGMYGAGAFFWATLRISGLAALLALPGSLILGLFLSDYARPEARKRYRLILDVLSSIPAVIYGLFALMFVTPLLQQLLGINRVQPYNALSASLILGLFITPYMTRLMTEALTKNGADVRRAAMALGATRFEMLTRLIIPEVGPGLASAFILGFSRAVGESIIVGMVSGSGPAATSNPLLPAETVTGYLLRAGSNGRDVVFAFGAILFAITLGLNIFGDQVSQRRIVEVLR